MADTKLKVQLPKDDDEANGLVGQKWAHRFLEDTDDTFVAIVLLSPRQKITDFAKGTTVPVVSIVRIEAFEDEAEAEVLRQKMVEHSAERLGLQQLPLPTPIRGVDVLDLGGEA